jgi:hypothetical protein
MNEWTTYWEDHYQVLRRIYSVSEWERFGTKKKSHPEAVDFRNPCASIHHQNVKKRREHMHWMIEQLPKHVAEGKTEKAHRWVGFLHGYAVSVGMISLMDLMERSRVIETDDAKPAKTEKPASSKAHKINTAKSSSIVFKALMQNAVLYSLYQNTINKMIKYRHLCKKTMTTNDYLLIELRKQAETIEKIKRLVRNNAKLFAEQEATLRKKQAEIERLELELAETVTKLIHAKARAALKGEGDE